MGIKEAVKSIFSKSQKETDVLKGEGEKNKVYASHRDLRTEDVNQQEEFAKAKKRLFDVNSWNQMKAAIEADFTLYDKNGNKIDRDHVQKQDYIHIDLPGPFPIYWVQVEDIYEEEGLAEFVVRPSQDPVKKKKNKDSDPKTEHFFTTEATSTFRVTLKKNILSGYEIGRNEKINNRKPEAGKKAIPNFLAAEGGWLYFQEYQWNNLTDYFVEK